jgi:hypothetical protein
MRCVWLALLIACKSDPDRDDPRVVALRIASPKPRFQSETVLSERDGRGRIEYLGLDVEPPAFAPRDVIQLVHYFRVVEPVSSEWDVFVHGETPEGERVLIADHAPVLGKLPTTVWEKGDVWSDPHKVLVPDAASGTLVFYAGLFKGDLRMTVEGPPRSHDGRDRVRAAAIRLGGSAADDLPETVVGRATSSIVADGKLDEPAWTAAPVLAFSDSMGRKIDARFPTKLRLLYDDQNLYVGFESTDGDITEQYSKRDDPIYEHETVELFIMPGVAAPDLGPYIELQASPTGVIFDASFTGRRQGMDKSFDAGQQVGTTIDGTLNVADTDRGWISEWIVPFAKMKWVTAAPKPGAEWRLNAFRIEKFRAEGQTEGEFTAWSPPRVGDFHNVARFGKMKFGP